MGGPGERALILLCRVDLSPALGGQLPDSSFSEEALKAKILSASMKKMIRRR